MFFMASVMSVMICITFCVYFHYFFRFFGCNQIFIGRGVEFNYLFIISFAKITWMQIREFGFYKAYSAFAAGKANQFRIEKL